MVRLSSDKIQTENHKLNGVFFKSEIHIFINCFPADLKAFHVRKDVTKLLV